MRRIIAIGKNNKKILVNIPSYDEICVNNQFYQPAYDTSTVSNGTGATPEGLDLTTEMDMIITAEDDTTLIT